MNVRYEEVNGNRVAVNDWRLRWQRIHSLPSFVAGVLTTLGIGMAHQDYYGLERYIELCREQWIQIPWVVGAAIACAAYFSYRSVYRKERAMFELYYAEYRKEAIAGRIERE